VHRLQELVRLQRMGAGPREVARQLKISPNTERDYRQLLEKTGMLEGDPACVPEGAELREVVEAVRRLRQALPQHKSSVERWRARIELLDG